MFNILIKENLQVQTGEEELNTILDNVTDNEQNIILEKLKQELGPLVSGQSAQPFNPDEVIGGLKNAM